jgi:hypothetical protein
MSTIYTSVNHLQANSVNQGFGNHLLHLFYCLNVSIKRKINLRISDNSNLDTIFDLEAIKEKIPSSAVRLFAEEWGGEPAEYIKKDFRNLINSSHILYNDDITLPDAFWVEGWFHNTPLQPSARDFSNLIINNTVKTVVFSQYANILKSDAICLHYRGTDFAHYNNGWGDVRLSLDYYRQALHHLKNNYPYIKNVYVFTDDKSFTSSVNALITEFPSLTFNNISREYYIDWLIMHFSKNIICSNSTFCLTAALYNKSVVYQPYKFLFRDAKWNIGFPTNPYLHNAHII